MTSPLDPPAGTEPLPLPGLEADNLLAVLALLGLLRALETSRPEWRARASWTGQPWQARLHLAAPAREDEVAAAAGEGVETIAATFDVGGRNDVKFDMSDFREFVRNARSNPTKAALAAALAAEYPPWRKGGPQPAPLVMMFGQGHQHFLARLATVPRTELRVSVRKKNQSDASSISTIAQALFRTWDRKDKTESFRWDPEDDQRYAYRFGDPSRAGAAPTVHGANRLAAVGFLSFPVAPRQHRIGAVGASHDDGEWAFVWPIWVQPLSLRGAEMLLAYPGLTTSTDDLRTLGVADVLRARRVSNGQLISVTRAVPLSG